MEDGFESEEAVEEASLVGSALGAGKSEPTGDAGITEAGALVGEGMGLSPSVAACVVGAGSSAVAGNSCAARVAGALASDVGFTRPEAGTGLVADGDSGRGALEFVGVATAGALVAKSAGEFELSVG